MNFTHYILSISYKFVLAHIIFFQIVKRELEDEDDSNKNHQVSKFFEGRLYFHDAVLFSVVRLFRKIWRTVSYTQKELPIKMVSIFYLFSVSVTLVWRFIFFPYRTKPGLVRGSLFAKQSQLCWKLMLNWSKEAVNRKTLATLLGYKFRAYLPFDTKCKLGHICLFQGFKRHILLIIYQSMLTALSKLLL